MVVIEIENPKELNIRFPSGNEEGANDLWLVGGHLPTRHDEAVTDPIPKGKYKEMSISQATDKAKRKK